MRLGKGLFISSDGVANYVWSKLAAPGEDILEVGRRRYENEHSLVITSYSIHYTKLSETSHDELTQLATVDQLTAAGQIEPLETLPSFHYQAAQGAMATGALRLPWNRNEPSAAVGVFARDEGAKTPGRLIASAKSWLCHAGVDLV